MKVLVWPLLLIPTAENPITWFCAFVNRPELARHELVGGLSSLQCVPPEMARSLPLH